MSCRFGNHLGQREKPSVVDRQGPSQTAFAIAAPAPVHLDRTGTGNYARNRTAPSRSSRAEALAKSA